MVVERKTLLVVFLDDTTIVPRPLYTSFLRTITRRQQQFCLYITAASASSCVSFVSPDVFPLCLRPSIISPISRLSFSFFYIRSICFLTFFVSFFQYVYIYSCEQNCRTRCTDLWTWVETVHTVDDVSIYMSHISGDIDIERKYKYF